ncbi:hypothetical protein BCR32DRAFT_180827, partial [Anaeromyces robustus]
IKHGANINIENMFFETPLYVACRNGNENIVNYLIKHGADINRENENSYGFTPLLITCSNGYENVLRNII